jgi:hypothetical protein
MAKATTADELEYPELVALIRRQPARQAEALAGIAAGRGWAVAYHAYSLRALVARGLVREGTGSIPTPPRPPPGAVVRPRLRPGPHGLA